MGITRFVFAALLGLFSTACAGNGGSSIGVVRQEVSFPKVMSFDTTTLWTLTQGSATLSSSTTKTEGAASLRVAPANGGWMEMTSAPMSAPTPGSKLAFDLRLPHSINPWWAGAVQLYLEVPSQDVYNQYVGQIDLTGKPWGSFLTMQFSLSAAQQAVIAAAQHDLRFRVVLNVPSGTTSPYFIDNMRFPGVAQTPPDEEMIAEQYRRVVGFEDPTDWTGPSGTQVESSTNTTEGDAALAVTPSNGGWIELGSIAVEPQHVTETLDLDVFLPGEQPDPYWYGTVQVLVSAPSVGVSSVSLGSVDLTGLAVGRYHTLSFSVPASLRQLLAQMPGDLRFKIVLNLPPGANRTYLLDRLRFRAAQLLGFDEDDVTQSEVDAFWSGAAAVGCQPTATLGGDYWKDQYAPLRGLSPAREGNCWVDFDGWATSEPFQLAPISGRSPALVLTSRARRPVGQELYDARIFLQRLSGGQWVNVQEAVLEMDAKWTKMVFGPFPVQQNPYRLAVSPLGGVISIDDIEVSSDLPQGLQRSADPNFAGRAALDVPHVWGAADFHTHPLSNLAFGGELIAGHPDDQTFQYSHDMCGLTGAFGCLAQGIVMDGFSPGHQDTGFPDFRESPTFWEQGLHNQMHVQWLERAWRGGMRLIIADAVNNMLLARYFMTPGAPPESRGDMEAVRVQIAAIEDFVAGHDFMEIAYTPTDARNIIAQGKLAVVLGAEIDDIGQCHANESGIYVEQGMSATEAIARSQTDCSKAQIANALDELEALGVRHIFPIHLADNDFGGAAVYEDAFNYFQRWFRKTNFCLEVPPESFDVHRHHELTGLFTGPPGFKDLFSDLPLNGVGFGCSTTDPETGEKLPSINSVPLNGLGEWVLPEMWRRRMMVDVDHMSAHSRARALELAEQLGGRVMAGHTGFRDLALETNDNAKRSHENMKTRDDVGAIRNRSGVIGVGTGPTEQLESGDTRVPNDCAGSTKTYLHSYAYADQKMGGRGVGIGTDMSLTSQTFPRFGSWACLAANGGDGKWHTPAGNGLKRRTDADAQTFAVAYDTPLHSYHSRRFMRGDGDEGFVFRGTNHECFSPFFGTNVDPAHCNQVNYNAYNRIERAFWQALVFDMNGADPLNDTDVEPLDGNGLNWGHDVAAVQHFTLGLRGVEIQPYNDCDGNFGCGERRVAFLVSRGLAMETDADGNVVEPSQVADNYYSLVRVWNNFHKMLHQTGNQSAPLERCVTGNREFDFNIDGLAHYGLLPDMFQDMSNLLRNAPEGNTSHLGTLFASASDYIDTWEKLYDLPPVQAPTDFDQLYVKITNGDGTLGENTTEGFIRLLRGDGLLLGPNPLDANFGWLNEPTSSDDGVWGGNETQERTFALSNRLSLADVEKVQIELEGNTSCNISCKNWTIKTLEVRLVDSDTGASVCLIDEDSDGNGNWYQDHVARLQEGGGSWAEAPTTTWRFAEVNLSPTGCQEHAITTGGIPNTDFTP